MQKGKIYGMGSSTIFLDLYSINCRDWTRVHCSNLKGKPYDSAKRLEYWSSPSSFSRSLLSLTSFSASPSWSRFDAGQDLMLLWLGPPSYSLPSKLFSFLQMLSMDRWQRKSIERRIHNWSSRRNLCQIQKSLEKKFIHRNTQLHRWRSRKV